MPDEIEVEAEDAKPQQKSKMLWRLHLAQLPMTFWISIYYIGALALLAFALFECHKQEIE